MSLRSIIIALLNNKSLETDLYVRIIKRDESGKLGEGKLVPVEWVNGCGNLVVFEDKIVDD